MATGAAAAAAALETPRSDIILQGIVEQSELSSFLRATLSICWHPTSAVATARMKMLAKDARLYRPNAQILQRVPSVVGVPFNPESGTFSMSHFPSKDVNAIVNPKWAVKNDKDKNNAAANLLARQRALVQTCAYLQFSCGAYVLVFFVGRHGATGKPKPEDYLDKDCYDFVPVKHLPLLHPQCEDLKLVRKTITRDEYSKLREIVVDGSAYQYPIDIRHMWGTQIARKRAEIERRLIAEGKISAEPEPTAAATGAAADAMDVDADEEPTPPLPQPPLPPPAPRPRQHKRKHSAATQGDEPAPPPSRPTTGSKRPRTSSTAAEAPPLPLTLLAPNQTPLDALQGAVAWARDWHDLSREQRMLQAFATLEQHLFPALVHHKANASRSQVLRVDPPHLISLGDTTLSSEDIGTGTKRALIRWADGYAAALVEHVVVHDRSTHEVVFLSRFVNAAALSTLYPWLTVASERRYVFKLSASASGSATPPVVPAPVASPAPTAVAIPAPLLPLTSTQVVIPAAAPANDVEAALAAFGEVMTRTARFPPPLDLSAKKTLRQLPVTPGLSSVVLYALSGLRHDILAAFAMRLQVSPEIKDPQLYVKLREFPVGIKSDKERDAALAKILPNRVDRATFFAACSFYGLAILAPDKLPTDLDHVTSAFFGPQTAATALSLAASTNSARLPPPPSASTVGFVSAFTDADDEEDEMDASGGVAVDEEEVLEEGDPAAVAEQGLQFVQPYIDQRQVEKFLRSVTYDKSKSFLQKHARFFFSMYAPQPPLSQVRDVLREYFAWYKKMLVQHGFLEQSFADEMNEFRFLTLFSHLTAVCFWPASVPIPIGLSYRTLYQDSF